MPQKVSNIIKTLNLNGFEGYMVGGCVRDSLLGLTPKDYDITTNAKPEDVINMFPKTIPTGIAHGTVTILIDKEPFEITTFRIDGEYKDSRRPSEVIFVEDIVKDLSRRDFTINAMAYNDSCGIIDPFNGIDDLNHSCIRCVGISSYRFQEDALRILRAIRFSSQLNFKIHKDTLKAIEENSYLLKNISAERIRDEFSKMVIGPNPSLALTHLISTRAFTYIHERLLSSWTYRNTSKINLIPNKLPLRLCYIFLPLQDLHLCKSILKKLRFDNATIINFSKAYGFLLNNLDLNNEVVLKKVIYELGKEDIFDFLELLRIAQLKNVDNAIVMCNRIINNNEPLSIKDLCINGDNLKELGITHGKSIGITLNILLEKVLKDPLLNNYNDLAKIVTDNFIK